MPDAVTVVEGLSSLPEVVVASVGPGRATSKVVVLPSLKVLACSALVAVVDVDVELVVEVDEALELLSVIGNQHPSQIGVPVRNLPCLLKAGPADTPRTAFEAASSARRRIVDALAAEAGRWQEE